LREEDIRIVAREVAVDLARIRARPLADRREGELVLLELAVLHERLPERRVRLSVLARVAELVDVAVLEPDERRSVDVRDERVERVLQPGELEALALEHCARLDHAARRIRLEVARLGLAP